ncbi:MAG: 30S ribosomal protein S18 [Anaerolineales bacterium]|nr:30S ribosomal protein S18 [Anaerolineales bacterium]
MDQNPALNPSADDSEEVVESSPRYGRAQRQVIKIAISDAAQINYKNVEFLRQFLSDSGNIRPRRQTGVSAHQQRRLAQAVKRARHMALLPFTEAHER